MNIVQILSLALVTVFLANILKAYRPEFATVLVVASGVIFLTYICGNVGNIFEKIRNICEYSGINIIYIEIMYKIIAMSYICEFVSSVCKDAGESSVAVKVDIAGKIIILSASVPILEELLGVIANIST